MKKRIIIIMCVLIILSMFILLLILKLKKFNINNNMNLQEETIGENNGSGKAIITEELQPVYTYGMYYMIEQCVTNFINSNDKDKLSSAEFIKNNYNDINNILNNNSQEETYTAKEMYMLQKDETSATFFVYGKLNYIHNIYAIVNIDLENTTYEIQTIQYFENIKKEELTKKINEDCKKFLESTTKIKIEKNDYNKYKIIDINKEGKIKRYFEDYKKFAINNLEEAYLLLDEQYKNKRFESIENFKNYIDLSKDQIAQSELKKYAEYKYDGYTQYVCLDNNGNYYIFNETSVMNYKVLLDTYTIDQPEFIKKYDAATEEQKAGYNINKFIQAINAKDYNYAYNCLAESFKKNNFPTLESFENYAKNTFFNNNTVQSSRSAKEGNYYVYTLTITDANNSANSMQKQFIVNLKENREFEMSFEIE